MESHYIDLIKAGIAAAVTAFTACFGILAVPLVLLFTVNVADYITGIAATRVEGGVASSSAGIKGIYKKVAMYVYVMVGWLVDAAVNSGIETIPQLATALPPEFQNTQFIAAGICYWIILNELISITENLYRIGVDVPVLRPALKLVKVKVEDNIPEALRGDDDE